MSQGRDKMSEQFGGLSLGPSTDPQGQRQGYRQMRMYGAAVLALLVGIVIGAAAVTGVSAQGSPGAYAIIDIAEITDPDAYSAILANAPAGLVPFGGRYVIRSDKITAVIGSAPKRYVVIAFDSLERARRWSDSAPAKELDAIRSRAAKSRTFIVEGLAH